nr:MAG TPA: hypothetical protein [Caudoviricetes sp.]DAS16965.1 MAG TPA: hypothetical protein [Caudoviricetes sp.]
MEITKRKILVSIIGIVILLSIGLLIDNFITYQSIKKQELYNKTLKIDNDKDIFKYAIDTDIGNVLVSGKFNVDNGVKLGELKQDYMAIQKKLKNILDTQEKYAINAEKKLVVILKFIILGIL